MQDAVKEGRRFFDAPTPAEAARFRAMFRRRQTIFYVFTAASYLSFAAIVIVCSRVNAIWPAAVWAAGMLVIGGLLSIVVWRCPRCGTQFRQRRAWGVKECLYCGLQLR